MADGIVKTSYTIWWIMLQSNGERMVDEWKNIYNNMQKNTQKKKNCKIQVS